MEGAGLVSEVDGHCSVRGWATVMLDASKTSLLSSAINSVKSL